ncbi:MAG: hypothetical protein LLG02_01085 [Pelosinus sp.]|nr:hypothetical protein [Pelosinus sp.]
MNIVLNFGENTIWLILRMRLGATFGCAGYRNTCCLAASWPGNGEAKQQNSSL